MKEVRAIIRPQRVARVREALRQIPNFPGVTFLKAEGFTAPANQNGPRTVAEELTDFVPKVVVSVICADAMAATIEAVIVEQASTGQIGDGLVWVVSIDQVLRIRNGTQMNLDAE